MLRSRGEGSEHAPMTDNAILFPFGIVFALMWLVFLINGSALIGGSIFKPIFVKRRINPVGYIAVMVLIGGVAAFGIIEGLDGLRGLPS